LARHGLHLRDARGLTEAQADWRGRYFREHVAPVLHPVVLTEAHVGEPRDPFLGNGRLDLAVELRARGVARRRGSPACALRRIPAPPLGRFVELPEGVAPAGERAVLFLDDVVRHGLPALFPRHEVGLGFAVKLTRDADLQVEDEFSGDLVEKIRKGLARRSEGIPSRFLYDARMPHNLLVLLQEGLELEEEDLIVGGRYHRLSDLWTLPLPDDPALAYPPFPPLPHPELAGAPSLFEAVAGRDRLLH